MWQSLQIRTSAWQQGGSEKSGISDDWPTILEVGSHEATTFLRPFCRKKIPKLTSEELLDVHCTAVHNYYRTV
jgi:hypothetical protein